MNFVKNYWCDPNPFIYREQAQKSPRRRGAGVGAGQRDAGRRRSARRRTSLILTCNLSLFALLIKYHCWSLVANKIWVH